MDTTIDAFGMTDIGQHRSDNQDQFLIGKLFEGTSIQSSSIPRERVLRLPAASGTFLVVADGMGGHVGGKIASTVAVECFTRYLRWKASDFLLSSDGHAERLKSAVVFAHQAIRKLACQQPGLAGMGTTLTAAYVLGRMLYVVHAGDSRCYLIQKNNIEQLTTDQTLAQLHLETAKRGTSSPDHRDVSPAELRRAQSMLWNCLGGSDPSIEIQVVERAISPDDRLVLCSDGLSKHVDEAAIADVAGATCSVESACEALVAKANRNGGSDNITVIVGQCIGTFEDEVRRQRPKKFNRIDDDTDPYLFHPTKHVLGGTKLPTTCS